MAEEIIGMGMHEPKDAKDAWCPNCKQYWGIDTRSDRTIYYIEPRDPTEKAWQSVCSPCLGKKQSRPNSTFDPCLAKR